jgi:hypothetical protein
MRILILTLTMSFLSQGAFASFSFVKLKGFADPKEYNPSNELTELITVNPNPSEIKSLVEKKPHLLDNNKIFSLALSKSGIGDHPDSIAIYLWALKGLRHNKSKTTLPDTTISLITSFLGEPTDPNKYDDFVVYCRSFVEGENFKKYAEASSIQEYIKRYAFSALSNNWARYYKDLRGLKTCNFKFICVEEGEYLNDDGETKILLAKTRSNETIAYWQMISSDCSSGYGSSPDSTLERLDKRVKPIYLKYTSTGHKAARQIQKAWGNHQKTRLDI